MTPTQDRPGADCPPAGSIIEFARQGAGLYPCDDEFEKGLTHMTSCPYCHQRYEAMLKIYTPLPPLEEGAPDLEPMEFLDPYPTWKGLLHMTAEQPFLIFEQLLQTDAGQCGEFPAVLRYRLELQKVPKQWRSQPDRQEVRLFLFPAENNEAERAKLEALAGSCVFFTLSPARSSNDDPRDEPHGQFSYDARLQWTDDKSALQLTPCAQPIVDPCVTFSTVELKLMDVASDLVLLDDAE